MYVEKRTLKYFKNLQRKNYNGKRRQQAGETWEKMASPVRLFKQGMGKNLFWIHIRFLSFLNRFNETKIKNIISFYFLSKTYIKNIEEKI